MTSFTSVFAIWKYKNTMLVFSCIRKERIFIIKSIGTADNHRQFDTYFRSPTSADRPKRNRIKAIAASEKHRRRYQQRIPGTRAAPGPEIHERSVQIRDFRFFTTPPWSIQILHDQVACSVFFLNRPSFNTSAGMEKNIIRYICQFGNNHDN